MTIIASTVTHGPPLDQHERAVHLMHCKECVAALAAQRPEWKQQAIYPSATQAHYVIANFNDLERFWEIHFRNGNEVDRAPLDPTDYRAKLHEMARAAGLPVRSILDLLNQAPPWQ